MRALFRRSLELARTRGRSLQVALDTTPIWGRGAVKDTYNLLADGIRQLLRTLALTRVLKSPCSGKMAASLARPHCECQHK